jgi:hypothetical protein
VVFNKHTHQSQEAGIMIKHRLFLRWWLSFTGILIGLTVFTLGNGWAELFEKDATKLSFIILAMFLGMSQWCGYKTWLMSRFLDRGKKIEDEHMIKQGKILWRPGGSQATCASLLEWQELLSALS